MHASGRGFSDTDSRHMRRALDLALRAKGTTAPNPAVGAVLVRGRTVAGEGYTAPCGGPHAERRALRKAGRAARGATLYVSLEPCCHHGRTPPCTDAIIRSGVRRVVVAVRDPNPAVAGKGIRALRAAGIQVQTGLCRAEAAEINEDFFWWVTRKAPWVVLKLAMTLDGRIADRQGTSKWITSARSRAMVHSLRARCSAVAVGRGTLLADDPSLTVRHVRGRSPARVVFSSTGRIPASSQFVADAGSIRSIVVRGGTGNAGVRVRANGVEVWHTGRRTHAGIARAFLAMAYHEGLQSVLIEGGQGLASTFLTLGLVNRIYLFYGNTLLGGGLDGVRLSPSRPLRDGITLSHTRVQQFGQDCMVTGMPVWDAEREAA